MFFGMNDPLLVFQNYLYELHTTIHLPFMREHLFVYSVKMIFYRQTKDVGACILMTFDV